MGVEGDTYTLTATETGGGTSNIEDSSTWLPMLGDGVAALGDVGAMRVAAAPGTVEVWRVPADRRPERLTDVDYDGERLLVDLGDLPADEIIVLYEPEG